MRHGIATAFVAALLLACSSSGDSNDDGRADAARMSASTNASAATQVARLRLDKVPWGGCVAAVRGALSRLDGVKQVNINAGNTDFSVNYDPKSVTPDQIASAVRSTGEGVRLLWSSGTRRAADDSDCRSAALPRTMQERDVSRRKSSVSFGVLTVAVLVAGCGSSEPASFQQYTAALYDGAVERGKPILIYATADWWSSCIHLERGPLSDEKFKKAVEGFVRLKIDFTERRAPMQRILEEWEVEALPTLIFVSASGQETDRIVGNVPAARLTAALRVAEAK